MHITAQGLCLRNDLYCAEWDVKLYYTITIPYHTCCRLLHCDLNIIIVTAASGLRHCDLNDLW